MTTLNMIRRIRDIQNERAGIYTGFPTLLDLRIGYLLAYLRSRYFRDHGHYSPI